MFKTSAIYPALLIAIVSTMGYSLYERSKFVDELNQIVLKNLSQAPQMVAPNLRLDTIKADYPAIIFYFTYYGDSTDLDGNAIKANELKWLKANACSDSSPFSSVLDKGFVIKRHYSTINGEHLALVVFDANNCR